MVVPVQILLSLKRIPGWSVGCIQVLRDKNMC
jgi:hypothetical protein